MKTGIVMEVKGKYAVVMLQNGSFKKTKSEQGWKQGDIVFLSRKSKRGLIQWIGAAAACFIIFLVSTFGFGLYYEGKTIISVDVNPSIELVVNRWNRVIDAEAYNEEGEAVLSKVKINNKSIDDAICLILSNGLENYILEDSNIFCTVQNDSKKGTLGLKENLRESFASCLKGFKDDYDLEIYGVDDDMIKKAHSHHITAGKYMILMQLEEVNPDADIDEYCNYTIAEIRDEIERSKAEKTKEDEESEDAKVKDSKESEETKTADEIEEEKQTETNTEENNTNQTNENNNINNSNSGNGGRGYRHHGHCN